jgi:multidrug resistance efflux pump
MKTRTLSLVLTVTVVVAAAGVAVWQLSASTPVRAALRTAKAARGNVVVTVGGLGRIVTGGPKQVSVPSTPAGPGTGAGATAPSAVPGGAVFPAASGRVVRILVAPGESVRAGQPIAALDDGGTAATALAQARDDLATARVELAQKRVSDPTKGSPPTPAELSSARLAVEAAQAKLAVLAHPTSADISAARYEVQKAKGDYATLTQGPTSAAVAAAHLAIEIGIKRLTLAAPTAQVDVAAAQVDVAKARAELDALTMAPPQSAVDAANLAVALAKQRIADLSPASTPADVLAAQVELRKAEADLAALTRGGTPSAVAAAQAATDLAQQKLAQLTGAASQVGVDAARLELEKAQADLAVLRKPAPRATRLAGRAAIVLAERKLGALLHPAPSLRRVASADVAKALADLDVLRHRGGPASPADIEAARLKVDAAAARVRLAAAQAARLKVRAATSGTVTAVLAAPGSPADPTSPIITVANLHHLEVSVDLSEFDAARVRRGQHASVAVDALGGKRLPGEVLLAALAGVDNGGVVTFPIRVGLSRSGGVKPGMNSSVRIVVAQRRNVVTVPLEAVSEGSVTVRTRSGTETKRHVVLGLASNKTVEIKRGLRAGETVVIAGTSGV